MLLSLKLLDQISTSDYVGMFYVQRENPEQKQNSLLLSHFSHCLVQRLSDSTFSTKWRKSAATSILVSDFQPELFCNVEVSR